MHGLEQEDIVSIRHSAVPGRLRLSVVPLHRNPELKQEVETAVAGISGVHSVSANPITGNVLILYSAEAHSHAGLTDQVARLLDARADRPNGTAAGPSSNGGHRRPRAPGDAASAATAVQPAPTASVWYAMPAAEVARRLNVDPEDGLDPAEAEERRRAVGRNRFPEPEEPSLTKLVASQFANAPAALLGAGVVLSIATGAVLDALLIGGVLVVNAAIGAATERSGRRAIAALRRSVPIPARVQRGETTMQVNADDLVPGDVVYLLPGDPVPADARILDAHHMQVEESALTGESLPVEKTAESVDANAPLADRTSMAYRGTTVVSGHGRAIVVATGRETVMGRLRALAAQANPPPTPLERDLDRLGRQLAVASAGICVGLVGLGALRGVPLVSALSTAIALGVAAVPEGLPATATTVLALGSGRMRAKGTLIRSLSAAEALGSVTVVCADKTGTLTENRMTAGEIWVNSTGIQVTGPSLSSAGGFRAGRRPVTPKRNRALAETLRVGVLCSDAEIAEENGDGELSIDGSPTEGALLVLARKAGMDIEELRSLYPRVDRRDRDGGRRHMITVHGGPEGLVAMAKGAPDELLELCDRALVGDSIVPLDGQHQATLSQRNAAMAESGMRVLAFASKQLSLGYGEDDLDGGFVWCGLVGLVDPVRAAARGAVSALREAGVRTAMITGDQAGTAVAVGRKLGLDEPLRVLEAGDLKSLDPEVLRGLVHQVEVFARFPPEMKLEVVKALQANGDIVAMTGDGVNDAPALRAADVGVAMGERGTELARELADVVLSTDDLARMVDAVEEGRLVRANVRRVIHYLLSTNASEVWAVSTAVVLGFPSPLTPAQLLWLNLVTDLAPAIGLATEPKDPDLMRQPPRDPREPIIPPRLQRRIIGESAIIASGSLVAYGLGMLRHGAGPMAQSMAFWSLITGQLMHVPLARAGSHPVTRYGRSFSRSFVLGLGASVLLQAAVLVFPPLRALLGVSGLGLADGLITMAAAAAPIAAIELQRLASNSALPAPEAAYVGSVPEREAA